MLTHEMPEGLPQGQEGLPSSARPDGYNPAMYELLKTIDDPAGLRRLDRKQLPQLVEELRAYVLESVARTGGHLSSNLGTVELTIALHYVFRTPEDLNEPGVLVYRDYMRELAMQAHGEVFRLQRSGWRLASVSTEVEGTTAIGQRYVFTRDWQTPPPN